jgi:integrase
MSRRSGQSGHIVQKGRAWYVRFWLDVPGKAKRVCKAVRICPVSGPGALNKSACKRRAKQIIEEFGANSEETLRAAEAVDLGTRFSEQATRWLEEVQRRKRRPVKPHTASTWSSHLAWINAQIGEMPLSSVNNLAVKNLIVARMAAAVDKDGGPRFMPKTITNYVQVVKMVIASAVDENGEEMFPVKWKHDFMDLPEVHGQRTPTFTAEVIEKLIEKARTLSTDASAGDPLLFALLAGSGLRIGEALALQVEDIEGAVIRVTQSLWNTTLGTPKTRNGVREIDLSADLADALRSHLEGRSSGFVFQSSAGGPLHQSNTLRRSLHPALRSIGLEPAGFHAFRRFRVTHLRKQRVPENLIRFWIGHADKSITDEYDKVREDLEFRRIAAESAGLGFVLSVSSKPVATGPVEPMMPNFGHSESLLTH